MTIKELIKLSNMNCREFGRYFNINHNCIYSWFWGRRVPPKYLVDLMQYKLINENIIKNEKENKYE